jgi:hypothetical protein
VWLACWRLFRAGLPDFSLFKIPKRVEIYQIATKLPNDHKLYQYGRNIFQMTIE